jgi:hypothetical protein
MKEAGALRYLTYFSPFFLVVSLILLPVICMRSMPPTKLYIWGCPARGNWHLPFRQNSDKSSSAKRGVQSIGATGSGRRANIKILTIIPKSV